MEELLGGKVDIIQTFPASEGFFAFQDDYQKKDFTANQSRNFLRIYSFEEYGKKMQKKENYKTKFRD
jgi:hypothetical protein